MKHLFTIAMLLVGSASAQEAKEKELFTEISKATVFIEGAHIHRKGETMIPKGKTLLQIRALSPHVNGKSINVKAEGNFTVLAVNHRLDYLTEVEKDEKIDSLTLEVEKIDLQLLEVNNKQEVLSAKQNLLNTNTDFGGSNGVSIDELKKAVLFFETETRDIRAKQLQTKLKKKELEQHQLKLARQINELSTKTELPTSVIEIRVEAKTASRGFFTVDYPVANAGWFPKYDIRVTDVSKPLDLHYKANVYQNTGIDWKEIKLSLSTADPNASGIAPKLSTWFLNYERNTRFRNAGNIGSLDEVLGANGNYKTVYGQVTDDAGEGLPGVNVVVKGTTIGTTTDLDGNYKLTVSGSDVLVFSFVGFNTEQVKVGNRPNVNLTMGGVTELQEVVVTGYGSSDSFARSYVPRPKAEVITTTVLQNQTSFTFELDIPYSVKSHDRKLTVDLKKHEIPADYQYFLVPKLDQDAFLIAQLVGWDKYNLLAGEANLFFEGTYVGQTILDPKAFADTLDISLGRDRGISVSRVRNDEFSQERTFGGNKIDSREFKIMIRNQKNQQVKMRVFDQVPVAVVNEISIDPIEISGGRLHEKSGIINWDLTLDPQKQGELLLRYEVKYPKKERVVLE